MDIGACAVTAEKENSACSENTGLKPAVFKLGSADQRGSATGSHGGHERIPKSSNCLHGF